MYESFYGFREKPFSLLPDPEFLYLGGRYRTALGVLEYGVLNQAGFIVITGETGTGKTTLLRKLLAEVKDESTVGILAFTHGGWNSLIPWILMTFNLPWKGKDGIEQFQTFSEFLMEESVKGRRVILIVDEAQNLVPGMLEELRLLSNLNADKAPLLQIILSGQPALRALLQRPDLAQFAQRVAVDYTLEAMDEKDTAEYIRHRIRIAGGDPEVFTAQACAVAYRLTSGLPRLINQVCDMALAYGFAEQSRIITGRLVAEAARDRSLGCILPLATQIDVGTLTEEAAVAPTPVIPQAPVVLPPPSPAVPMTASGEPEQARPAADPDSWLKRGQWLRKQGRQKDALRALAKATGDPVAAFRAYTEAGFCYREAGRINEAAEAFRRAFSDRTAPREERVAVCYELGRTLETARKAAEALDCYRRVHRVDPHFQDVARRIERLSGEPAHEPQGRARTSDATRGQRNKFWIGGVLAGLQRLLGRGATAPAMRPKGRSE
jgi:type II secretory pathway predicted ATPase ExeA